MKKRISLIALLLIVIFCMADVAGATVRASEYIEDCFAQIRRSDSKVTVTFDINGKNSMDVIGAQTILIQEKTSGSTTWSTVATYSSSSYSNMLSSNTRYYKSSVNYYNAKSDCEYRAKVYFYAEKGGYDTREFITLSV